MVVGQKISRRHEEMQVKPIGRQGTCGSKMKQRSNRFLGKEVWKCIRDMQHCKRGRIASCVATIHDEDDVPCVHSINVGDVILLGC